MSVWLIGIDERTAATRLVRHADDNFASNRQPGCHCWGMLAQDVERCGRHLFPRRRHAQKLRVEDAHRVLECHKVHAMHHRLLGAQAVGYALLNLAGYIGGPVEDIGAVLTPFYCTTCRHYAIVDQAAAVVLGPDAMLDGTIPQELLEHVPTMLLL